MKAWRLERLGGELRLKDVPTPEPRPGGVLVRITASALMSYLKPYVQGLLPIYNPPTGEFTPGTNGVGVVAAVGRDVWHLAPGQRVVLSSHFVARENVEDPAPQLAALCRCIVPFGGLLRGRLAAGETLIVTGATGAYGTAAVLLGIAMGAGRVIAAGRNPVALAAVARAGGPRVSPVALTGDVQADVGALREASGGGAQMAFDMVGQAADPNATLAALHSLRRGGRLVLMGSMIHDLPVPYTTLMLNSWEILGQFMYPADAYRRLLDLLRSGLLDISPIRPRVYPLAALPEAMEAAAAAGNLECVVVQP